MYAGQEREKLSVGPCVERYGGNTVRELCVLGRPVALRRRSQGMATNSICKKAFVYVLGNFIILMLVYHASFFVMFVVIVWRWWCSRRL